MTGVICVFSFLTVVAVRVNVYFVADVCVGVNVGVLAADVLAAIAVVV